MLLDFLAFFFKEHPFQAGISGVLAAILFLFLFLLFIKMRDVFAKESGRQIFIKFMCMTGGVLFSFVAFILISPVIGSFLSYSEKYIESNIISLNDSVSYAVSWFLLLIISFFSVHQIREILTGCENNTDRKRANYISIIIGMSMVVLLFSQPFLDMLFKGKDTSYWVKSVLFGGGGSAGWVTWYLSQIKRYGEFFHILSLTLVSGLCWYARLTAPDEVKITAVAFLLGSLFHISKQYIDKSSR